MSRMYGKKMVASLAVIAVTALTSLPQATLAADASQETFATPQQAVDALVAANRAGNKEELLKIFGPKADNLISSGDPVADKEHQEKFLAAYNSAHQLESKAADKDVLVVGNNGWPFPIPLVRQNNQWRFDTEAGEQEVLNRRIGHNELHTIEVCRAYVEAQREYAAEHPVANGKHEYAQHFLSHNGMHDGLYWEAASGEKESPLGPLIASAQAEGYDIKSHQSPKPYHGYYYKILTSQSGNASGGALNYVVNGHMTQGFALLAFPDKYGDSGIMTFMVNQNGIVHEKDLGPNTSALAAKITQYDPDKSWAIE